MPSHLKGWIFFINLALIHVSLTVLLAPFLDVWIAGLVVAGVIGVATFFIVGLSYAQDFSDFVMWVLLLGLPAYFISVVLGIGVRGIYSVDSVGYVVILVLSSFVAQPGTLAVTSIRWKSWFPAEEEESEEAVKQVQPHAGSRKFSLSQEKLADVKKLLKNAKRVRIDMFARIMGVDRGEFEKWLVDWADKYGFIIDADIVIVEKADIEKFIASLSRDIP